MLRLEPRSAQSLSAAWLSPMLALVLTVLTGGVIFLAMGKDPGTALYIYFVEPLTSSSGLSEVAVKAGPLILIGIGLSFGFRAGICNIGAEGQYIAGAIAGGGSQFFGTKVQARSCSLRCCLLAFSAGWPGLQFPRF